VVNISIQRMHKNMTGPYEWGIAEEKKQTIKRFQALTNNQITTTVDSILDLLDSGSFSKNKMNRVAEVYNLFWRIKHGNKVK
tara:strand:- start:38 stop:283 length:246 start_codon:yes stop_codon:yes gene_type:complete